VQKFRRDYDEKNDLHSNKTYDGTLHFAQLNAMALFVMLYCVWNICQAVDPIWRGGLIICFCTFLFANSVEYCKHRFDMHHPESESDHSPVHHRYFTATSMFLKSSQDLHTILFRVPFVFKGLFFVLPLIGWIISLLTFGTAGYYFLFTSASYYLQYEWLHLIYHASPDSFLGRLPFVGLLRRHHRVHHHQPLMR
jgi:hypothetical protein